MGQENFKASIKFRFDHCGNGAIIDGLSGPEKYGIKSSQYPGVNLELLTADQAEYLYKADIWMKAGCHAFRYPLDMYIFECACSYINNDIGIKAALHYLSESGGDGMGFIKAWIGGMFNVPDKLVIQANINKVLDLVDFVDRHRK